MGKITCISLALVVSGTAWAGERPLTSGWFDWDRYHARQDACAWKDRIVEAYTRGWCDNLAFRQAQRDCSAFGPLEERR